MILFLEELLELLKSILINFLAINSVTPDLELSLQELFLLLPARGGHTLSNITWPTVEVVRLLREVELLHELDIAVFVIMHT